MTPEQQAAYTNAMTACAIAELFGMLVRDLAALRNAGGAGAQVYSQNDYEAVPARLGLTQNQVLEAFRG